MKDFTVVLPIFNCNAESVEMTKKAVESFGDVDIIAVDNASTFETPIKFKTLIKNSENLGYAKAVNMGIKLATTRYVAMGETDVVVSANWQEVAKEVLAPPFVHSCHFRMYGAGEKPTFGDKLYYTGKERWCSAPFFVMKRNPQFLFDEEYLNSFEDWDITFRIREAGYNTAYTNRACFVHNHSYSKRFLPASWLEKDKENRQHFTDKHGEDPDYLMARKFPEQMGIKYTEGWE